MSKPQTLPQSFLQRAQLESGRKVALRQKEFGVWKEFTWQESYEQVKQ